MVFALWSVQILLALLFLLAGGMKATLPKEKLVENLAWAEQLPLPLVRLIGVVELLGAVGVVLPVATGILPWLTPLAAVGLVLTMIGAMITHLRRSEYSGAAFNVVLLVMAAFVAYGRFVVVS